MAKYMKLGTGQLYTIYKANKLLFLESKKKTDVQHIADYNAGLITQWKLLAHILAPESLIHQQLPQKATVLKPNQICQKWRKRNHSVDMPWECISISNLHTKPFTGNLF